MEEDVLDKNGVVVGKKKVKRKRGRKKKRKKKRSLNNNQVADGETAKKKIRSKLNSSGGHIKRGSGFQLPKHHVRPSLFFFMLVSFV